MTLNHLSYTIIIIYYIINDIKSLKLHYLQCINNVPGDWAENMPRKLWHLTHLLPVYPFVTYGVVENLI